jgi:hypothetical protein
VCAERPAEAAWRDVTIAKSKHLMPPLERHRSTLRVLETTLPGRLKLLCAGDLESSGYGKDMSMYALEGYTVARHVVVKL